MGNTESTTTGNAYNSNSYGQTNTNRSGYSRPHSGRMTVAYMRPSELRYSQDSIGSRFQDGHTLDETFRQILFGEIGISRNEVPPLVVTQHGGYWYVIRGNRRLYLMKKLEEIGQLNTVKVLQKSYDMNDERFNQRVFRSSNTNYIRIRGDPTMEQKLNQIVAQWRRDTGGARHSTNANNDWCTIL